VVEQLEKHVRMMHRGRQPISSCPPLSGAQHSG
jgi:hypothetical protein